MAAIQAVASASSAYQREAARFVASTPKVGGKVINREATVSFGPFRVSYAATDYEFDLTGAKAQTSFADALDAAATTARLADTPSQSDASFGPTNAISRRLALAGYQAAANAPQTPTSGMFSATA
ncbi:conserved hypothetical protein [Solidesulfovibrio fructosivorans JJ]]|uniref:Uncharacterized protein n=1 Tax=Solidesulfovibrio fructosivorans JJ] TaxID=596151 RepID=E1JZP1_SOLFR|nr:hypothetical protein [Solidesulfovibrio fructosivorans]EFL50176.1 conserved hypothetical protein [Solidesulfovibrio fructosivorans JJ]]